MKRSKKAVVLLLAIFLALSLFQTPAKAENVSFLAINDTILPLSESNMPVYEDGVMYLSYSIFTSYGLGIYLGQSSTGTVISLYNGNRVIFFDLNNENSFDQEQNRYSSHIISEYGTWYVPASFVCSFFGFLLTYISAQPADVVRIRSSGAVFNDSLLVTAYSSQMQQAYDEYMGVPEPSPSSDIEPSPSPSPSPEEEKKTYEDVTLYFSLVGSENASSVASALQAYGIYGCFFVTGDDIMRDADIIRSLYASGHSIGLYLTEGTEAELTRSGELLYEAAKIKTIMVSADDSVLEETSDLCKSRGLIMWFANRTFDGTEYVEQITDSFSTTAGDRQNIMLDCAGAEAVISDALSFVSVQKYSVGRIRETTTPTLSMD